MRLRLIFLLSGMGFSFPVFAHGNPSVVFLIGAEVFVFLCAMVFVVLFDSSVGNKFKSLLFLAAGIGGVLFLFRLPDYVDHFFVINISSIIVVVISVGAVVLGRK